MHSGHCLVSQGCNFGLRQTKIKNFWRFPLSIYQLPRYMHVCLTNLVDGGRDWLLQYQHAAGLARRTDSPFQGYKDTVCRRLWVLKLILCLILFMLQVPIFTLILLYFGQNLIKINYNNYYGGPASFQWDITFTALNIPTCEIHKRIHSQNTTFTLIVNNSSSIK